MIDFSVTLEKLEQIQNNLKLCREWFHSTLHQPYTVEEMTTTLEYYWNNHLYYYSNKPGQVPEKQQRIFQLESRFEGDHFRRTQAFSIELAATDDKLAAVRSQIAQYEHPFKYNMQGRCFHVSKTDGKGLEIVIPNIIDYLKESHSPYFEFIFDGDLQFVESNYGRDIYDFFCDVHFLQFLRQTLVGLPSEVASNAGGKKLPKLNRVVESPFPSLEAVFKNPDDYQVVLAYLQSSYLLSVDGTFIDASGNKKYIALLPKILKSKNKIKPIDDKEIARLMGEAFNMSITPGYLSKNFIGRDELMEEIIKDLRM